ncbi:uncharacterized protein SPAPADRAFT_63114 [Spathaspora passalidarum NRRL Y-27907]|uniref:Uncharacterized protein n=1 Tax=Spathaspora passalidarum (strain NRRL Y-27907 / 11-Y1) TaxID=619300 RepID=G3ATN9_SPAPN|nr:uncharacterized protein SPAPADRAFT_63114 [Spathaspora passalidarum NRRL Y-27907]EGW30265.1 hypothetical protein SPAPADRAFT_63114 [Spathaspora passalidarum NRRL Y-27907]
MDNYLGPSKQMNQENKENQYPEPLKAKRGFSITKPLSNRNSSIPILKPIHQNAKTQKLESFLRNSLLKSPKRICSPSHRIIAQPGKSVLRRNGPAFVVESSTGLINEATKFGTELNTANCEGFPFPETESEIVQIPTNEDNLNKMAIIRMIKNKQATNNDKVRQDRSGFYNESEFKEYRENRAQALSESTEGVQLVSQNINSIQQDRPTFQLQKGSKQSKKSVKWADNLEW